MSEPAYGASKHVPILPAMSVTRRIQITVVQPHARCYRARYEVNPATPNDISAREKMHQTYSYNRGYAIGGRKRATGQYMKTPAAASVDSSVATGATEHGFAEKGGDVAIFVRGSLNPLGNTYQA